MAQSICISSAYYPPHMGGVEAFTQNLANTLVGRGVAVTVVTNGVDGAEPYEATAEGVEVFRLPAKDPTGRFPVLVGGRWDRAIWRELESRPFDGIVVNTRFYPLSLKMLDFARKRGARPVLLEHGSSYLSIGNPAIDQGIRAYEDGIATQVRRARPRCYGVSREAAEWLRTFGLEPSGVIHNSIDAAAFRAQASGRDFRDELGLKGDVPLVVFTGRLIPEKGIFTLAQAAAELADTGATFLVAGDGPQRERLQAEAPANVKVLGRLDRPDVAALLLQSDIFCFPSEYPEGLPTSLLEAAACGCYLVSAPVAGAGEVVPDAAHGCVMRDASVEATVAALSEALADPAATREAAARCQARVETEFTWDKAADQLLAAI